MAPSENPNDLRIDNTVVVVVCQRPWETLSVVSHDLSTIVNNLMGLATTAAALEIPIVLTSAGQGGDGLTDPIVTQLTQIVPGLTPIVRGSTNGWAAIRPVVERIARRKLLLAGLWTEVAVTQTALGALKEGYRVYLVSDTGGGLTREAHEDAKTRLVQAGATPINWVAAVCEWAPGYGTPERDAVAAPLVRHAGAARFGSEPARA